MAASQIPDLYSGQVHYMAACSRRTQPLRLQGLAVDGSAVAIDFQTAKTRAGAPYLAWCKSRIQRLVAEGSESAAVALSKKANLLCKLTAFVAWDEQEKVAVAGCELVQPNQQMEYFCRMPRSHARRDPGLVRYRCQPDQMSIAFDAQDPLAEAITSPETMDLLLKEPFIQLSTRVTSPLVGEFVREHGVEYVARCVRRVEFGVTGPNDEHRQIAGHCSSLATLLRALEPFADEVTQLIAAFRAGREALAIYLRQLTGQLEAGSIAPECGLELVRLLQSVLSAPVDPTLAEDMANLAQWCHTRVEERESPRPAPPPGQ